jgi:hypothetical protein
LDCAGDCASLKTGFLLLAKPISITGTPSAVAIMTDDLLGRFFETAVTSVMTTTLVIGGTPRKLLKIASMVRVFWGFAEWRSLNRFELGIDVC